MGNGNLPLYKLLGRDLWDNRPVLAKWFWKSLAKWRNEFFADLAKLLILAICVGVGYLVFLYYLGSLWAVFADTPMGNVFATRVSPAIVAAITVVLALDLSHVAFNCVINTLLITVPIGILLKFTGLYRLFFLNHGFSGAIFWGIVCTMASAKMLPIVGASGSLSGNVVIYLLPSISLLVGSFNLSARLVPEFTIVFEFVEFIRERLQIIKIRDLPYDRQEI